MCRNTEKPVETIGCNTDTAPNNLPIMEDLVREFLEGSVQAVARMITLAENGDPRFFEFIKAIYPGTGKAYVVGITGAPGTGKSTLTDAVTALLREQAAHRWHHRG